MVRIPFTGSDRDTAILLLAAAEDLGLDRSVVRTYEGGFDVPDEVHEKAFGKKRTRAKKSTESGEGEGNKELS